MFMVSIKRKNFVIPRFIDQISKSKNLSVYGDGTQVRAFCDVRDAARGLFLVMSKGKRNETYNIGNNEEPISILDLARKVKKLSKK